MQSNNMDMADNTASFDPKNIYDKESIRKNIRNALSSKLSVNVTDIDLNAEVFTPIPNKLKEFANRFYAAGGKLAICDRSNMVSLLVDFIKKQSYNVFLNTSPDLGKYLDKNNIRYRSSISSTETASAVLTFSDALLARSGSVGFSQLLNLYPSVKNLASDIIIVSFEQCIFTDVSQVMDYQAKRNKGNVFPITEFITPTTLEIVNGKEQSTLLNPRFILFLVRDVKPATPAPQPSSENPAAKPDYEKNAEHEEPND